MAMNTQKTELLQRLHRNGWDVAVLGDHDPESYTLEWWVDEAWKLTSLWSPRGLKVYLAFIIDLQVNIYKRKQGENVWAVKATLTPPTGMFGREGEVVFSLRSGWRDELSNFISELSALRSSAKATE